MGIPQSRPKYSRSTFQTFQHKVQVKVTPAQSTLGQHSSPKYRSRLLGTDSSSPWYNRPTICTVSIPAHYTGHAYLTDPSHGTTGPQYTCSTFQPTVQVKSTGTDSSSPRYNRSTLCTLSIPAQCTGQAYLSDPARGTTAQTSPLYAPSTIRPSIQASLFVNWNYPTPKFDISHDEWRVILDQVRTMRIDAKGFLSLQPFVHQAVSPILQVSRTYNRPIAHRQSYCGRYRTGKMP